MNSLHRNETIARLTQSEWQVIVIGGGITGAGIALDAVSRGLKTCLIDQGDFASGTSSRSTRLIHGGLRYLRNFEFGLVRETGRERTVLQSIAPFLVQPGPMLLPLRKGGTYNWLSLSLGLKLYDWLAGVPKLERRKMLDAAMTTKEEPLLRQTNLKGAGLYKEYRTDDARLTLALLKTATHLGADCLNYCRVESLLQKEGSVVGVRAKDRLTDQLHEIKGKVVVNAAGPWVDEFRTAVEKEENKIVHSKGVHIVVKKDKLPLKHAVYFDAPQKRLVFAIPVPDQEVVYIGTTDTRYDQSLAHPLVNESEANELLVAVNETFSVSLTEADVISCWAGVRPLISQAGKSTAEISRRDEILHSPNGLITIAGGKLTGYRKMAERIVDVVTERLGKKIPCRTKSIQVTDAAFLKSFTVDSYAVHLSERYPQIPFQIIVSFIHRYGSGTEMILEICREGKINYLVAEWRYTQRMEGCVTLNDFLVRRTRYVFSGREKMNEIIRQLENEPITDFNSGESIEEYFYHGK